MNFVEDVVEHPKKLERIIRLIDTIANLLISAGKFVSSFFKKKAKEEDPIEADAMAPGSRVL